MFRGDFLGGWLFSLVAGLHLPVTIATLAKHHTKHPTIFCSVAEASKRSGLSVWVGQELGVLGGLPDWAMVVIVCILVNIHSH